MTRRQEAKQVTLTFRHAAEACSDACEYSWRNPKHRARWPQTLVTYAFPQIGDSIVGQVTAPMGRDGLSPIWLSVPERRDVSASASSPYWISRMP